MDSTKKQVEEIVSNLDDYIRQLSGVPCLDILMIHIYYGTWSLESRMDLGPNSTSKSSSRGLDFWSVDNIRRGTNIGNNELGRSGCDTMSRMDLGSNSTSKASSRGLTQPQKLAQEVRITQVHISKSLVHSPTNVGLLPTLTPSIVVDSYKPSHLDNDIVQGLDDDMEIIVQRLTGQQRELDIVTITGMSGIGKTTLARKLTIISQSAASSPHEMKLLNLENGIWKLLRDKVFGPEHDHPHELEEIGKKIAEKCQGLPLTILVLVGYLSKTARTS
ncbi:hypothetical protein BC332_12613 [Capsicum chinense]|nr:hypothetical protein BC332_12613 [Capsicum chinense]